MSHAVIRLVSFLILAIFLTLGKTAVIIFAILLTTILYFSSPPNDFHRLFHSLLRMKWLFLSIMLVYLFLDPAGSNKFYQFMQGGQRVLILLLIFLLVSWLIRSTPRDQLIAALIRLLSPLGFLGFPVDKFSLRIELVLASIVTIQNQISEATSDISIRKNSLKETGRDISGLYQKIVYSAEQVELNEVNIRHQTLPTLKQWASPLLLFVSLYFIHNYL